MATVYGIEVAGETYNIEDTNARQGVETNANNIDGIEGKIPDSASSTNKLATENDIPQVVDTVESGNSSPVSSGGVANVVGIKKSFSITPPSSINADTFIDTGIPANQADTMIVSIRISGVNTSKNLYYPVLAALFSFQPTNGDLLCPLQTSVTTHAGTCEGVIAIQQAFTGSSPTIKFKISENLQTVDAITVTIFSLNGVSA